jgi:hypothetical protein
MKTIELASRNATRTLFGYSDKRSAYPADIAGTGLGEKRLWLLGWFCGGFLICQLTWPECECERGDL